MCLSALVVSNEPNFIKKIEKLAGVHIDNLTPVYNIEQLFQRDDTECFDHILIDLNIFNEYAAKQCNCCEKKIRLMTPVSIVLDNPNDPDGVFVFELSNSTPAKLSSLSIKQWLYECCSKGAEFLSHTTSEEFRKIQFFNITLNCYTRDLINKNGIRAQLTCKEYALLEALIFSVNKVLTRDQLLDKTRGDNLEIYDRAIDIQVARLRKKLGLLSPGHQIIKTVRGVGYILEAEVTFLT